LVRIEGRNFLSKIDGEPHFFNFPLNFLIIPPIYQLSLKVLAQAVL